MTREKAEKRVREAPRFGEVTEGGHHWYMKSWSRFNSGGTWMVWCEECLDYHHVKEIDPLTMTEAARNAFGKRVETRAQVVQEVMRGER